MSPEDLSRLAEEVSEETGDMRFIPTPGPQMEAYYSKADLLLYGGKPGGGKTSLILGLAVNEHERSLVVRKTFAEVGGVIDNLSGILGSSAGIIRGMRPRWSMDGKVIHFEGMPKDGKIDTGKQGTARDYVGVDEALQLTENQVRSLFGWVRTVTPGQRCRMVLGSNPPLGVEGRWAINWFRPWLDPDHPNQAKCGELRYFIFDSEGNSVEVPGPGKYDAGGGLMISAHSRTFIRSTVEDNPFLDSEDYMRRIAMMPEPHRSILLSGNFLTEYKDQDYQLIPSEWVAQAQARWVPEPPPGVPMCCIAGDVALSRDRNVLAIRHDGWYAPLVVRRGDEMTTGDEWAAWALSKRRDNADMVVDMGGGYGNAPREALERNISSKKVHPYKGSISTGDRSSCGHGFANTRSQAYWAFREALDPSQQYGSPISIPNDPELIEELCAPTFEIKSGKIYAEAKDLVIKKLGRSPDKADAVVMAWHHGQKGITSHIMHGQPLYRYGNRELPGGNQVKVNRAYENRRRRT